jgi:hypothetical protein
MYERRHQAASLATLLVVTLFFVWACSSGGHEDASVTTSGGAGSALSAGSAAPSDGDDGAELGAGGTIDSGSPASMNVGGSGSTDEPLPSDLDPSSGGEPETGSDVGGRAGSPPLATGGSTSTAGTGTSLAGAPSAGAPAAGGAPAVVEPVCDPADDHSSGDLFLPCEVSTALYVCRNCHSNPPVKGLTSSYVTFADIKPHAAQIYSVIKNGYMPWPPYTMSAWQKATALKWLGKNGSCAIGAAKPCQ